MEPARIRIISIGALISILLITTMVIIRNDVQTHFENQILQNKYKLIQVESFKQLDFSQYWTATIKQGIEYKVELLVAGNELAESTLEVVDGILYLRRDSTHSKESQQNFLVTITTPQVMKIRAEGNTKICVQGFTADSLTLELEKGSYYTGRENNFKQVFVSAVGGREIPPADEGKDLP